MTAETDKASPWSRNRDDPAEALIHALEEAALAMGGPRPGSGVTNVRNVALSWLAGKGQLEVRSLTTWDGDYARTDQEDDALLRAARIAHADAGHAGRLDMCSGATVPRVVRGWRLLRPGQWQDRRSAADRPRQCCGAAPARTTPHYPSEQRERQGQ